MFFYKLLVSFKIWAIWVNGSLESDLVERETNDFEKQLYDIIYEHDQKPTTTTEQKFDNGNFMKIFQLD